MHTAWAVVGIASKHSDVQPVATAGWVVVGLVALLVVVLLAFALRNFQREGVIFRT